MKEINGIKKISIEICKAEIGALLFNLGKTHAGIKLREGYLVFDSSNFEKQYGYSTFSRYRKYYDIKSGTPFDIDLDKCCSKFKPFFYNTKIDLSSINVSNLMLKDVIECDAGNNDFVKRILFRGCENINSGIDKGAPKEELDKLYISNAFGTPIDEIVIDNFDKARIDFFKGFADEMGSSIDSNNKSDILKVRTFMLDKLKRWYTTILSDTRFPANDVTLWDQAYMTASLFKATIAAMFLDDSKKDEYYNTPSLIRWSIMGVQYDKLALAEKALNPRFIKSYRAVSETVDEKIKEIIEEDYALGNEVYRDETGIYFIVPENLIGGKTNNEGLYKLNLKAKELEDDILEIFKTEFGNEVFPAILLTEPSRGTMNISRLLKNNKENFLMPITRKISTLEKETGFKVLCDVCKTRLAEKEKKDLHLCKKCQERINEKYSKDNEKNKDIAEETVWTGELQDKNGRIALITVKFELDEWLNGNLLSSEINRIEDNVKTVDNIKFILKGLSQYHENIINESDYHFKFIFEYYDQNKTYINDFLMLFDEEGVKKPFTNTIEKIQCTHKKDEKEKVYSTIKKYLSSFLKDYGLEFKMNNYNTPAQNLSKYLISIYPMGEAAKSHESLEKFLGKDRSNVLEDIFTLSYITSQIKQLLLERSIGEDWEELIKGKLGNKIDYEKRKIDWKSLQDEEIDFLSKVIYQFIVRKNPSPARLRRVWESTSDFLMKVKDEVKTLLDKDSWKWNRISWKADSEKKSEEEYELNGLNFINFGEEVLLISSIKKAIPALRNGSQTSNEEIQKAIERGDTSWIKKGISIKNVKNKEELKLNGEMKYIKYIPFLSIIEPTPISWQFAVPAEYAPEIIKTVQNEYYKSFGFVTGKLPLHIGVVFQSYKKPLYVGIKALRNIRRDLKASKKNSWDDIKQDITGKKFTEIYSDACKQILSFNTFLKCESNKKYYGLYKTESNVGKVDSFFMPGFDEVFLKSIDDVNDEDELIIYPNTVDFEFLDVNTRRNDIFYENKNRTVKHKKNRPYDWEKWKTFETFGEYFKEKDNKSKLQVIVKLIYEKTEISSEDKSIKDFMLSSFINIFELKKETNKNTFAQKVFGTDSWENLNSNENFIDDLYRFLDMYDFWHNCLKEL